MNQDLNLVAGDYYEREIEYQDQIDRIINFRDLEDKPVFDYVHETKEYVLKFPGPVKHDDFNGQVHFFRPSNAALDRVFQINDTNKHVFSFEVTDMVKGRWIVKINWVADGKEYYFEKIISL